MSWLRERLVGYPSGELTAWLPDWLVRATAGGATHLDQAEPGRVPIVQASIRLPHTDTMNKFKMWKR